MANISNSSQALARSIVEACVASGEWPADALDELLDRALGDDEDASADASRALFGTVIEPLGDLFEPRLCAVYVRLFARVIERALPEYAAESLTERYHRIRRPRRYAGGARRVCVLSRVTLGADVAVTSVALAAARQIFPDAEICFVGPAKNGELFAADAGIRVLPVCYGRSARLRDRLNAAADVRALVDAPDTLVIDPDSRLTQLGLLPVCEEERYLFFESRSYGGDGLDALPLLTARWLDQVLPAAILPLDSVRPYLAPAPQPRRADITVSLGVGENPAKRLDDAAERAILDALLRTGKRVLLDRGAGGEEAARVDSLRQALGAPPNLLIHDGSYASFASQILQSRFYVGYDSAGQHVAAAGGVPLVAIFAGYASLRMRARWQPSGQGPIRVVDVNPANRDTARVRALEAIAEALAEGDPW